MNATIRIAAESDGLQIAEIYAPIVTGTATSFEMEAPDADEMTRRVRDTLVGLPWLVCDRGGMVAGYAYATRYRQRDAYRWSVEVSAYVHTGARRAGIGRGLYSSLLAVLALQGFRSAYAGITLPNDASVGLHEALGFETVGVYCNAGYKQGAWHDVGWWQRELRVPAGEPVPPIDFVELRHTDDCKAAIASGERFLHSSPLD